MTDEMEQQLQKLGRSINDATHEAYDVMISSNGTIVGDIFADKENTLNNKNENDDDDDGMSNRAGMEMGLALFGTTDTYKLQMDEEFRGKLSTLAKELDEIREGLQSLREEENNGQNNIIDDIQSDLDSSQKSSDDNDDIVSIDDIPHMQHHIQFLQQCAQAKTLLDDVEKLSFSNFATSSLLVSGTGSESNDLGNQSSAFLLSPSAQFSFRPTSSDVLKEGEESPMVKAARLIKEVDSILESATQSLKDENGGGSSRIQMRAKIFNELQTEACRFRSELKHRAITLIDRCIVVEEDKISVRGSGTGKKAVKFNMNSTADGTGDISSSPLSDAFEVLDSFSDPRFASFGETLDITMKKMAQKIIGTMKARMTTFESALANSEVAMLSMREDCINKTRRNAGNHYEDFTNVGGASIQLSWASTTVQYEEQDENDAEDSSTSVVSSEINEAVLKSAPSAGLASFISLLNYITSLLMFVHDHALLGRTELAKILGKYMFSPAPPDFELSVAGEESLMTDLLAAMTRSCIPKESSPRVWKMVKSVEHRLINEVGAFEDAMAKLNFLNGNNVDGTDTAASPLSKSAKSACQAYVETQRCQIINTGRSILLNTDYHNTSRVGHIVKDPAEPGSLESLNDDPQSAFLFQECSVSVVAQEVLRLCRQTLDNASGDDAAATIDTFPSSMYRASREVLDLFRAIIPTRYGKEIASIPRFAAVLHNDCVFLAHSCAFLGAEYKEKFSKLASSMDDSSSVKMLSEVCTFVDLVPPFRHLASKSMGTMIEMQKVQLYELISTRLTTSFTSALGSNESVSEWDDAETVLKAAIHHLRHLSQAWKNVLTRNVYNIAMGNLVDTVFVLFLEPVLKTSELSEPASQFMHYLYSEAVKGSAGVFYTDDDAQGVEGLIKVASKHADEFERMQVICEFMVMRLDDIQRSLEEGKFKSVKAKELSHLITAAFDESDKRKSLLNSLTPK